MNPRIAALALLLATLGCAPASGPPTPTTPPTATLAPSASPTPAVALAPTATATAVPPSLDLARPSPVGFRLPLTLQYLGPEGAVFFFELEAPAPGRLFLWEEGQVPGAGERVPLDPSQVRHRFRLGPLEPGRTYLAAVGLEVGPDQYAMPALEGQAWGPIRFRVPEPGATLRIAVIGDSGFGDDTTRALVRAMAELSPDAVLHTGDIVYRAQEEGDPRLAFVRKFYQPFRPLLLQAPFYPVMANHDLDAPIQWQGAPFYHWAFPPFDGPLTPEEQGRRDWYQIPLGPLRLWMLNSQTFFGYPGAQAQQAWLEARAAEPGGVPVAVMHVPPYSSGGHAGQGVVIAQAWGPLFGTAGVPLVLSGHEHNYERLQVGPVTYVISGGGSAVLYGLTRRHPASLRFEHRSHFLLLEVSEGRIRGTARTAEGEVLDRFEVVPPEE